MNINIFKSKALWGNLAKHNKDILDVWSKFEDKRPIATWFKPNVWRHRAWMRKSDRNYKKVLIKDLRNPSDWKLELHPTNYLAIFLINLLYHDRKNILIEDVCSGMGRLFYYLSKLGFNNFSAIDDFSGIRKELFENLMKEGNINYVLNQKDTKPITSNLANYPWYTSPYVLKQPKTCWIDEEDTPPKNNVPIFSCELFCFYCANNIFETIGKYLLENGYVELCQDEDCIQVAFCKKEKYEKFKKRIKPYGT